ncbi:XRE family transcriptional regulator, partial [Candidatus Fermentibacteria bacterium]
KTNIEVTDLKDTMNLYSERYERPGCYWGKTPSNSCYRVLQMLPPERSLRLLDIGCGEGRNAIFFARNGYQVTAFDTSAAGVEKTRQLAAEAGVTIDAFVADINEFRLTESYDVLFSTGVLQYVPPEQRKDLFLNYRNFTSPGGLNVFSVFVKKPFIEKAPDAEKAAFKWISGELFTYYHDWKIEYCNEDIFDCMSSGVQHQHAVNRIIARKEGK